MKKLDWDKLREKLKATDKGILSRVVGSVDGWTIFDPKQFTELGLDPEIVEAFTKNHKSGSHPKEQISVEGKGVVSSLKGVYGLELLQWIADVFGVSSWKMGRGFRAQHLQEQLVGCGFKDKEGS